MSSFFGFGTPPPINTQLEELEKETKEEIETNDIVFENFNKINAGIIIETERELLIQEVK